MGQQPQNRRRFLIQSVGVFVTAPFALGISRCDKSSTSTMAKNGDVYPIANQVSGNYVFDLAVYPALVTPGGYIQVGVNATSGYKTISIVRVDAATLVTVLMICPYSTCQLGMYNTTPSGGYYCFCDGSTFNADGSVRVGPATVPLTTYVTNLVGSTVTVAIT